MSGRPNRRFSLIPAILLVAVLLIAGGGWFFFRSPDLFRAATPLDVSAYAASANSLRGNTYKIEGEVAALLAWSPSSGRLISVGVEQGRRAIPVLLPNEFNSVDIQKGQKYNFLLVVDDQGMLRAKKLAKS